MRSCSFFIYQFSCLVKLIFLAFVYLFIYFLAKAQCLWLQCARFHRFFTSVVSCCKSDLLILDYGMISAISKYSSL